MTVAPVRRTRRLVRALLWTSVGATLAGAGISGLLAPPAMDLVLIQLVFYGAWAALLGGWAGGLLGAAVEEDACGELDMGVTSSMGAFVGAVALSLAADAAVGLALGGSWLVPWVGTALVSLGVAGVEALGVGVRRLPGFDARGRRLDAAGAPLSDDRQPWRMRDRFTVLVVLSVLIMLGLTGFMAFEMGSGFGSPLMLAPMAYGMSGGMLGGILGGWFAGLRDEHLGPQAHENSVMVASMALMSGMMGAMPAAMVAGMMAVMGPVCLWATVASGLLLAALAVLTLTWGRYRFCRVRPASAIQEVHADGQRALRLAVRGMICEACTSRVRDALATMQDVRRVEVDLATGTVRLVVGPRFAGMEALRGVLDDLGYPLA